MWKILCIGLLVFGSVLNCQADEPALVTGVWPGTITLPGKDKEPAHISVREQQDTDNKSNTKITMYVEETPLEFIDLKIRKNTLHFTIDTGALNRCVLNKHEGGNYSGFCETAGPNNQTSRLALSMRPPRQEETPPEPSANPAPDPD